MWARSTAPSEQILMRWVMVIAGLVAVFGTSACLDFGEDEVLIETVEIESPLLGTLGERASGPTSDLMLSDEPQVDADNDPCRCDNQSCIDQWVSKNLGCDVCVVLHCGSSRSHVCTHCDPTPGPGPE